ncbi:two-component sensor histidine kinase [Rhodoferax sp. AJA081-3]|uniref:sensor histidine kinase n=1 Tax=Rhodoferax sp. AJA081-3 TaxID=2752316 RepID=UPI001AE02FF2|nr:ATP-binding protein [Rhodoferax sp. AJA081-3]QTN30090.1 two-component sensor histidine kinase [Rhodoferax sp. AJA081-3]
MATTPPDTDARITALQAELDAVRAEMQHFTYAVSHDLRAPLRHILSYAQLVQEDAGPQLSGEVKEFLATITDSARHMGVLLDGLAALSRVGSAPLDVGPVCLQELIPAVCGELAAQHPERTIEWRIADDLPLVQADAALLRQALSQVLGNAVKFSAQRQPAVIEVDTAVEASSACVALQVRDNGVGYNPALQDQLFKVFGRLHSSKQFEGIGMGLVLVRRMLDRFGATVSIHGVQDGGSTVLLLIPRA